MSDWKARSLWERDQLALGDTGSEVERMHAVMNMMGLAYGYEIEVSLLGDTNGVPMWQVIQRDHAKTDRNIVAFASGFAFGTFVTGILAVVLMMLSS